ncbi:hypothetical protein Q0Z83_025280 [Actinoplanes sichuanensis]|uniref:Choice-of-anchor L domain-containing protein n=1 Tax=Actinoplanes sichuanensis TaxID=512349 RepID=A0ABW4A020_9ACTN|nr:choice-of-anchor L domain-containing protein [Actinoplanes sichuanensis]BEL04337.1 hypothetical protein Q0Z83_025280 [Actinoplanes sichuanensis]
MLGSAALAAPPGSGDGVIVVDFETPESVPALTSVTGKSGALFASKAIAGTKSTVRLTVPSGQYDVVPEAVAAGGKRYVGVMSARSLLVRAGQTKSVTVTYRLSEGMQEAHVTKVTDTAVSLGWTTPTGTAVEVRRTEGDQSAAKRSDGVAVATSGSGLLDEGLKPGTRYNYSFWAKPGDSPLGIDQLNGPFVLTVGTTDSSVSSQPSYVVTPGAFLARATDLKTVAPTGSGVRVGLADGVSPPAPGAGVVLPVSAVLRGGYVGTVADISQDGRVITLVPGGIGDAFDYYHLKIDDLSTLPMQRITEPEPATASAAGVAKAAASPDTECGKATTEAKVIDFDPGFQMAGHFETTVNTRNVLGADIPTGVSLDVEAAVTVSGAVTAKVRGMLACQIKVKSLMIPFPAGPVPMGFYFKPTVKVGVEGAIQVSNLGAAVTLGFQLNGHAGFDGANQFEGNPISTAQPLTPQIDAVSGGLFVKVSGDALIGPGAGTTGTGVIAGIGGTLVPLEAHANVVVPATAGSAPCLTFTASGTVGVMVSVRAWLGWFDFKADYVVPALQQTAEYPGSPWAWPTKCDKPINPSDNVLGDGVTKVDDDVAGSPDQWGHLDGFAPDGKAWVLSTGRITDATGSPGTQASTSLGNPGNATLSSYSGQQTYDAASYRVTLVPTGSTLNVKYVFASEEYPEYVGSRFNDVMAIFVNGTNCALVPGTDSPVSINTVNHHTNSAYYVDNSAGASGYSTSYDGLTTPLVCSVPVTPGVPTTVEIAVADAGDGIYDSAVALLDKGIWSN